MPGSSRRPRPGRPAAPFTEPDVVGPMQKSAASVGFETSFTGVCTTPLATTVPPIVPLSKKQSRNLPMLHVSCVPPTFD